MKKNSRKRLYLEKLGIPIKELIGMRKKIDDTYYNLCDLWLYGDIYYKLQNLHGHLDNLFDDEHLDEDELDEIWTFYENNYKN